LLTNYSLAVAGRANRRFYKAGRPESDGRAGLAALFQHAWGRKVSVGCERKWYWYEEDERSKKCAGQKAGEGAEGGDRDVSCGGNFPGNGFPDD